MSGIPVVITDKFGVPVRQVERGAPVMTVAANGLGIPIVLSDRGTPFIVEGLAPPELPGDIDDLSVVSATTTTAQLAFTAAEFATGYEYRLDGGEAVALASDKIIAGLEPDTTYEVQVRGVNSTGSGNWSNAAEIVTQAIITVPAQITDLAAAPGDGEISLTWTAPDDGGSPITDYLVWFRGEPDGDWELVAGHSDVPGRVVSPLVNGQLYGFEVAAVNAVGSGPWSAVVTATPESGELVVGPEYYDLADDFETPAGVTPMTGRAHWSGDLASWATDNGAIHQTVNFGPAVNALLGDAPWGDVDVTFDYRTGDADGGTAWASNRQHFWVWYHDAANRIRITFNTANRRLSAVVTVAGADVTHNFSNLNGTPGGNQIDFLPVGTLRVQIKDNILRIWLDGALLCKSNNLAPPWGVLDLSATVTDPSNRQGLVGASQNSYRWPVLDGIAVRATDIVCDSIDGAVGRDAYDSDFGTVTYGGVYSGAPVAWVSRLIDAVDRVTVLRDWQAVTATLAADRYTIDEALPLGGPYLVEHGWLDADGLRHTTLSLPTLVARRIITYGQSTSVGRGGGGNVAFAQLPKGAVPANAYNSSASYAPGYLINGLDPYVRQANEKAFSFTDAFQQIADGPVMFEAYGVAGSPISGLISGTAAWTDFTAALATRKGVIEAVIWDQGQGDVDTIPTSAAANLANYPARFNDGIVAPLRTLAGNPTLPVFISHMGRYGGAPMASLTQAEFDAQRDAHRRMKFALTVEGGGSDPHIHTSSHHNGCVYSDVYHFSPTTPLGWGRLNERDAWSTAGRLLGLPVHDGRGPIPTGVTRSGAVLTIALDLNGAGSLQEVTLNTNSGSAVYPAQPANRIKGWDFSLTSDFAALLPVTSLVVSGTSIAVTLASDPGAPVYARNLYGAGYNDSVMVHGVYSGADYDQTIPVAPTMAGPMVSS